MCEHEVKNLVILSHTVLKQETFFDIGATANYPQSGVQQCFIHPFNHSNNDGLLVWDVKRRAAEITQVEFRCVGGASQDHKDPADKVIWKSRPLFTTPFEGLSLWAYKRSPLMERDGEDYTDKITSAAALLASPYTEVRYMSMLRGRKGLIVCSLQWYNRVSQPEPWGRNRGDSTSRFACWKDFFNGYEKWELRTGGYLLR